ncbi:MAG: DUF1579 domain-containing protein [Planctomycetes bacterium]|nr:DUF1579 domain-containing protein [Planctomycetota bacterium]
MSRGTAVCVILVACTLIAAPGCMPKMTIEEMKATMPQRPAELDRLNDFVGKWKYEGEAKMAMLDEPLKTWGTGETTWNDSRWFIEGRSMFNMEHFGESQGLETWTYDIKTKKYRSTWVDSMGMSGTGVATYDEKASKWHMKATSYGPWGKSTMKGWVHFPDPDTMEWWMAEFQGFMKTMEMSGTGKRVQ